MLFENNPPKKYNTSRFRNLEKHSLFSEHFLDDLLSKTFFGKKYQQLRCMFFYTYFISSIRLKLNV